jgi:hypothetical protein
MDQLSPELKKLTTAFFMSKFINNVLIINIPINVVLNVENSQTVQMIFS